ncbi:hypothetical protein BGW38_003366 [Lunasporangiospora selenospora]|uniref:Zn(2)-C6 fungal-type domain-containing protein n=1 Tax=Lunasporangiospora selenospora TaxID=979761 RepID=A0A9P6FSS8_9FUNG|nr:hypothetical protein BGW38_003366 [Lunasporangiospora selenospora]
MSTSTLQLMPTTATELAQLDPATLASIPGVAYDLKRLKVYSSCLRCRAKKVKCDRKEPCARCEKHNVECSYRELASVQLDIRQFQRHLNNPKVRKDGAGIITSTATPIITLPSGATTVLTSSSTAAATLIAAAKAASSLSPSPLPAEPAKKSAERRANRGGSTAAPPPSPTDSYSYHSHHHLNDPAIPGSSSSTDTESDTPARTSSAKSFAMGAIKARRIHRRKPSAKSFPALVAMASDMHSLDFADEEDDEEEEIERVVLRDDGDDHTTSGPRQQGFRYPYNADVHMVSENEEGSDEDEEETLSATDVPIWRAQANGKHKQTAHEQALAEAFGLAAYLKAKEMEIDDDVSQPGRSIDYEVELERALAQRLPTSFTRPDRSFSRARKYAQAGYSPSLPYARPYCQLSSLANKGHAVPVAAHCCCQIAARFNEAPGTCYYRGPASTVPFEDASVSPPPQAGASTTTRISYSPSYKPLYTPKDGVPAIKADFAKSGWSSTPAAPTVSSASSPSTALDPSRSELPPIYLPKLPTAFPTTPTSSNLSVFQVGGGNNGNEKPPLKIECKYNEPNIDAWDLIEKPISRTVPVVTKRGRSVKMEMGWILS